MEPKTVVESIASGGGKPWRCSRVERLLKLIDALSEEVEKSVDAIDDDALQDVTSRVERVQEALRSERESRKRLPAETLSKLKQNQLPDRIKLSVGGKVFAPSLSTLLSVKDTFFESMFGGRWPLTPEADGTFFIGRDSKGFSMVLRFLRGDAIGSKSVSECELTAFAEDVDYYGLSISSAEQWMGRRLRPVFERFSSDDRDTDMAVYDEGMVCKHHGTNCNDLYVLGVNSYSNQDHVLIKMCTEEARYGMVFGVIGQRPAYNFLCATPTCYAFSSSYRWVGGDQAISWDRLAFRTGDLVEVEIDCKQSKLTVRNTTQKKEDSMELPAGKQWRLFVCMQARESSVRIVDSGKL